jgi:hypothetical protein
MKRNEKRLLVVQGKLVSFFFLIGIRSQGIRLSVPHQQEVTAIKGGEETRTERRVMKREIKEKEERRTSVQEEERTNLAWWVFFGVCRVRVALVVVIFCS